MRREDWFWVAVKVVGLWLAVEGVAALAGWMAIPSDARTLMPNSFLPAFVSLAVGVLLLLKGELLVPERAAAATQAADSTVDSPRGMTEVGLFWVACKVIGLLVVLGALLVVVAVLAFPAFDQVQGVSESGLSWKARVVFAAIPVSLVGAWLLLGEGVFLAASRNAG